jgi:hypothetical protein
MLLMLKAAKKYKTLVCNATVYTKSDKATNK